MKITRIEFVGETGRCAAAMRLKDERIVQLSIEVPGQPTPEWHKAECDDEDALFALAMRLQQAMDGCRGTNSMVHDFYRHLQTLAW